MRHLIEAGLTVLLLSTTVPAYANPANTAGTDTQTPAQTAQPTTSRPTSQAPKVEARTTTVVNSTDEDAVSPANLSERDRLILERRQQRLIPAAE